jgi:hypothetical protein
MAIGDTVQAGLLRADFSPIERGGAAKGRAYSAIGGSISNALDKFAKNKQEGEAAEMGINAMISSMDDGQKEKLLSGDSEFSKTYNKFLDGELSNSQKKSFLGGLAAHNTAYRQNMADQMAMDKFAIEQAEARIKAKKFETDQQAKMSENQFMQSLMSQTTSPQAQRQADIARPGLQALGNADARNRFMQAQLEDSQNQVPVSSLGSQDFGRFASREGLDPRLSVARMEELRQAEAEASRGTGKTMTINNPETGQNVIALQNPDGTPGRIVGIAPTQPPRIPDPRDVRRTNIDTKEDNQAMDTETAWRERAITGRNTTQTVKTMLSTLDKVEDTGGFSNFKNTLKKYAMSAGYDFTDAEKDQLANAEKFTQLSGEFVFKAISQTKGSISEKEMDLFQAMSPSMVNSKLGNRLMLEYAQKRADRDVKLNKYIQGLKKEGMLPQERVEMAMVWLNDPANDITQDLYEHFGTPTNGSPPPPQAQPNRPGVRVGNPQPSQGSQTSGGFQIKTR